MGRIIADYELESPKPLADAAAVIAGERSSGTFMRLLGESDDLRETSGARVEQVDIHEVRNTPSLPCRLTGDRFERGRIRLSWPIENMGPSLPNLLATVAGNLFELAEVSALRLLDMTFPIEFTACPGPAFGSAGTRKLAGVTDGLLIGAIIKPSVGLSPSDTAGLGRNLSMAASISSRTTSCRRTVRTARWISVFVRWCTWATTMPSAEEKT